MLNKKEKTDLSPGLFRFVRIKPERDFPYAKNYLVRLKLKIATAANFK